MIGCLVAGFWAGWVETCCARLFGVVIVECSVYPSFWRHMSRQTGSWLLEVGGRWYCYCNLGLEQVLVISLDDVAPYIICHPNPEVHNDGILSLECIACNSSIA